MFRVNESRQRIKLDVFREVLFCALSSGTKLVLIIVPFTVG